MSHFDTNPVREAQYAIGLPGIGYPKIPSNRECDEEYHAMKESDLVRKIIVAVKKKYPGCYVRKLADRFTRGILDVLILVKCKTPDRGVGKEWVYGKEFTGTLFVEVKTSTGVLAKLQEQEVREIQQAGGEVIVARDVDCVLAKLEAMGAIQ